MFYTVKCNILTFLNKRSLRLPYTFNCDIKAAQCILPLYISAGKFWRGCILQANFLLWMLHCEIIAIVKILVGKQ